MDKIDSKKEHIISKKGLYGFKIWVNMDFKIWIKWILRKGQYGLYMKDKMDCKTWTISKKEIKGTLKRAIMNYKK